ncbi:hypothetical protein [Deinococcus multiflagellatus]|uniref:Uncharacterized protein n=1 Tax=Deinococcus multiflagellatus TaxID=1656887 RepID=A0ABW1ZNY2_9DEIO
MPKERAHPPLKLRLAGLTLALGLASCGLPATPAGPVVIQTQGLSPAQDLQAEALDALHTPASATEAFMAQGGVASIPLTGEVPGWARELLDGDRLRADRVTLGEPVAVRSLVDLPLPDGDAAQDAESAAELQRTLAQVGDAALVPLLLPGGELAGWVRLPLLPVTPDEAAPGMRPWT